MSTVNLNALDQLGHRLINAPDGKVYAQTYSGADVLKETEITGWTSGPVPGELQDVYAQHRQAILLGSEPVAAIGPSSITADSASPALTITQSGAGRGVVVGALPAYAVVTVNSTRSGMDSHAFEDWSTLNPSGAGSGYSSFDAKATLTSAYGHNHFAGYQSRGTYNGAGNLDTYFHGYDTAMVHSGAGTIPVVAGIRLRDIGGAGPVTTNYGVLIDALARGTTKWGIFSGEGNFHNLGGTSGRTTSGVFLTTAVTYITDAPSKAIAYGFGTAGQANFGKHDFYDGKNGLIATIDQSRVSLTKPLRPGTYTVATLPAGSAGDTAYATNGRKVGEGAGVGTGVPVYYSGSAWNRYSDDTPVLA